MDLFTYLMSKNNKNLSIHGDLFSYLLGKGQSQIYTISGTTIYIPDAKKLVSFMMTKLSTQDGTPTPSDPQEIKTVKGYRNYLENDLTNQTINDVQFVTENDKSITIDGTASSAISLNIKNPFSLKAGTYTLFLNKNKEMLSGNWYIDIRKVGTSTSIMDGSLNFSNNKKTFTIAEDMDNLRAFIYIGSGKELNNLNLKLLLLDGTEEHPYVPYGNNYVNVAVSDGTNTNNYPIPLNNNEIAGIGDYLDELIVDKTGHVYLNKIIQKKVCDGTENWYYANGIFVSNYFSGIKPTPAWADRNQKLIISDYFMWQLSTYRASVTDLHICKTLDASYSSQVGIRYDAMSGSVSDFINWLSINNVTTYYVLEEPELIDLNTTVDLSLFKGVNNISNSEDGYMTIEYQ